MLQSPTRGYDLGLLLQAAEFIENEDKRTRADRDHGYAAPAFQVGTEPLTTKMKAIRRNQNRTSHNELEKNRRAHLRQCLDNLKEIVPLRQDTTRHTTLGLLKQASCLIKKLEEERSSLSCEKMKQCKRNAILKRTFLQLEISRHRRNSTGSTWSSGLSESSNDSDKDDEIIDVTEISEEVDILKAVMPSRSANLITINVSKPISLPAAKSNMAAKLVKRVPV